MKNKEINMEQDMKKQRNKYVVRPEKQRNRWCKTWIMKK